MVDECHHCPAFSFERVLSEAKARYLTGFTATPQRRDGQHPIIEMQLGPARFVVSARTQNQMEPFRRRLLIVATGRYIGEGFDDARLDTLFLALPVSWKGTIVQYAGRLNRAHQGKRDVLIYDYFDKNVPILRKMFDRRLRGYHAIGYGEEKKKQCP